MERYKALTRLARVGIKQFNGPRTLGGNMPTPRSHAYIAPHPPTPPPHPLHTPHTPSRWIYQPDALVQIPGKPPSYRCGRVIVGFSSEPDDAQGSGKGGSSSSSGGRDGGGNGSGGGGGNSNSPKPCARRLRALNLDDLLRSDKTTVLQV